jgi:hypothetical protein
MNLYDLLDGELQDCPVSEKKYLPLGVLDDLVTPKSVLASLNTPVKGQQNTSHLRYDDTFATRVVNHVKKLFTVLVFIGQEHSIASLLSEGLTDHDLPLSRRENPDFSLSESGTSSLTIRRSKSTSLILESGDSSTRAFTIFEQWKPQTVGHLLSAQWLVLAPVFNSTGSHFNLAVDCALPLLPSSSDAPSVGTPGNSEVKKCLLHADHYRPGSSVNTYLLYSILSAY